MQKKFLLYSGILLFIFVLYTGFGTHPDVAITSVNGYKWGMNYSSHVYLKLICFGVWILYFLMPDERNN